MTNALSPHPCPRCRAPLYAGHAAGVVMHGCGQCGGVWLATEHAQRVAQLLPIEAIKLAARASHSARVVPDTSAPAPCPACSQPMRRVHAAAARVDLDTCAAHGTWYDRDELELFARALQASGWRAAGPAMAGGGGMVAGAGMAAGAGMVAGQAHAGSGYGAAEVAADVALDVATEVGVEAGFSVVGAILGALFD